MIIRLQPDDLALFAFSIMAKLDMGMDMTESPDSCPLRELKEGETLFVFGHGNIKSNTVAGYSPKQLLDTLIARGLNVNLTRLNIVLIACNAGRKTNPFKPSFAEEFYTALETELGEMEVRTRKICGTMPKLTFPMSFIGCDQKNGNILAPKTREDILVLEGLPVITQADMKKHYKAISVDELGSIGSPAGPISFHPAVSTLSIKPSEDFGDFYGDPVYDHGL